MPASLWILSLVLASVCVSCESSSTSRQLRFTSAYAPVNGLQLYYEVHGIAREGVPPIVLIHGGGSTIESNWSRVIPLLSQTRRVIAIEEQGHGHTKAIDRPFTFENTADDVAVLLDYLKIERADIMGFSNGGTTALRIGQRHPGKVRKLVVISAIYRRDGMIDGFWDGFPNATIATMPKQLQDADRKINPDPAHLQQLFEQDWKRMMNFVDIADEDLKAIRAETLVMIGDRDVAKPEHALRMARTLPEARLMIVPGTHGDFLGEVMSTRPESVAPKGVVTLIDAFLDEPMK